MTTKIKAKPSMVRIRLKRCKNYTYLLPNGKALTFQGDRDYSIDAKTAGVLLQKEDPYHVHVFVTAEEDDKARAEAKEREKARKTRRKGSAKLLMDIDPDSESLDLTKMKVIEHEPRKPEPVAEGAGFIEEGDDPDEGIPADLEVR